MHVLRPAPLVYRTEIIPPRGWGKSPVQESVHATVSTPRVSNRHNTFESFTANPEVKVTSCATVSSFGVVKGDANIEMFRNNTTRTAAFSAAIGRLIPSKHQTAI